MKRWLYLLAAMALLLLPGCWSRRELTDVAPVFTAGFDQTENGQIEVTLGLIRPAPNVDSRGGGGRVLVIRTAPTIADALRAIDVVTSRRISFRHTRIILIGERLARAGTDPVLDFLARSPQWRLSARPFVVRGTSIRGVIETRPLLDRFVADKLWKIEDTPAALATSLKDFLVARTADDVDAFMPTIGLYPHTSSLPETPTELGLTGAVAFRKDRAVAFLGLDDASYALWLFRRGAASTITVPCPDAPARKVALEFTTIRRRIIPWWDGKAPSFQVLVYGDLRAVDAQCPTLDFLDLAAVQKVDTAVNKKAQQGVQHAIAIVQKAKSDPFRFGAHLRARFPDAWRQVGEAKWPETWSHAQVKVTAQFRIVHPGVTAPTPAASD